MRQRNDQSALPLNHFLAFHIGSDNPFKSFTMKLSFDYLTNQQKEMFESVVAKAEQLTGEPKEMFMTSARNRRYVYIRTCIVKALMNNGWVGYWLGAAFQKDHSTIVHLKKKYEAMEYQSIRGDDECREYVNITNILTRFASQDGLGVPTKTSSLIIADHMTRQGSSIYSVIGLIH